MPDPLVSVLTPSFNQARWLADNLHSVAVQSYRPIEHVVVDGGSSDGSVELLRDAGEHVRWVSEPDQGQSDALNKSLAMSKGEIIGWLNSDDAYFAVDSVERVVRFFDAHPEVDLVYGHSAYVNAHGLLLHMIWTPRFSKSRLRLDDFISQPTAFVRRRALGETLVDGSLHFAMDYDLWLRLMSQGKRFARVDRVLAIERVHAARKTLTIPETRLADVDRLVSEYGVIEHRGWARVLKSVLGILGRFRGLRLIRQYYGELAFHAAPTTSAALLRRQIAARRSRMDIGGG